MPRGLFAEALHTALLTATGGHGDGGELTAQLPAEAAAAAAVVAPRRPLPSAAAAFVAAPEGPPPRSILLRPRAPSGAAAAASFYDLSPRPDPATAPLDQLWENAEGLPKVSLSKAAAEYISPDMADSKGASRFKPTLACKCGDWRPAAAHPEIDFKPEFLAAHPDFIGKVQKLRVHMEDTTAKKVHWDAAYDIRRFLADGDVPRLSETTPAVPGSGEQLRFLTFCPPEGAPAHQYELKVTALDNQDNPIQYFTDKPSTYSAQGPPPPTDEVAGGAGGFPPSAGQKQKKAKVDAAIGKSEQQIAKAQKELEKSKAMLEGAKTAKA